jgi:hypothetical protein
VQPLDLNLATRPFHNNTLHWLGYGIGAVFVIATTFFNVDAYIDYSQRLENLSEIGVNIEKKTADLQRRDIKAQRGIAKFDVDDLSTQASKANAVIDAKAFSWTRLFNQLEGILPYDVRMVSVRPQFAFGRQGRRQSEGVPKGAVPVAVEGVARNLGALLDFERNLFDDLHFSDVKPDRLSLTPEGAELLFTLRFYYFPQGEPLLVAEAEAAAAAAEEATAAAAEEAAAAAAQTEAGPVPPEDVEAAPEEAGEGIEGAGPAEPVAADKAPAVDARPASTGSPTPNRVISRTPEEALDPGRRNDEPELPPPPAPEPTDDGNDEEPEEDEDEERRRD